MAEKLITQQIFKSSADNLSELMFIVHPYGFCVFIYWIYKALLCVYTVYYTAYSSCFLCEWMRCTFLVHSKMLNSENVSYSEVKNFFRSSWMSAMVTWVSGCPATWAITSAILPEPSRITHGVPLNMALWMVWEGERERGQEGSDSRLRFKIFYLCIAATK